MTPAEQDQLRKDRMKMGGRIRSARRGRALAIQHLYQWKCRYPGIDFPANLSVESTALMVRKGLSL